MLIHKAIAVNLEKTGITITRQLKFFAIAVQKLGIIVDSLKKKRMTKCVKTFGIKNTSF